ncbi:hypothetical protein SAMN02787073_3488 [Chryseobacterium vrystaatense]|jgi:hypothetical protein|uniref:Uncharacterized protein n=2 Tax=Chryseobacterium vrystaatense TaxID=307480 RepID=A0A1M5GWA2_9FLAO|nr:hypothetical protein SAMN02787073_3488 [Chryseobacterium vrystaatense]
MKKFIPFFSIMIAAVCMQNCSHRDEDMISNNEQIVSSERSADIFAMKQDSAKSIDLIENPEPKDPPVRDGDNWRPTKD